MTRTGTFACLLLILVGCRSRTPPEPEGARAEVEPLKTPETSSTAPSEVPGKGTPSTPPPVRVPIPPGHRRVDAQPAAEVRPSPNDPLGGKFSLEQALESLAGQGPLLAEIRTSLGKLRCTLYEDKAPITVANFVGLARGLRPFKNAKGEWVKVPGYDGTTFHRVVRGFMIQGGDPLGTGAGEPGYSIPDEIWDDAYHSERGLLCMANRGPNTNGMQFFITDGPAPHLDNGYTIFGKCGPENVIEKLAGVEVQGDRAVNPPKIQQVVVRRETPAPKATGAARPLRATAGAGG